MVTPKDAAIVRALAMLTVDEIVREHHTPIPYTWRDEMKQRLAQAIDLAIQDEREAIERELPE